MLVVLVEAMEALFLEMYGFLVVMAKELLHVSLELEIYILVEVEVVLFAFTIFIMVATVV